MSSLKKANKALGYIIIGIAILWFCYLGASYLDYKLHYDEYLTTSFPWYAGAILYGYLALGLVLVLTILNLILKRKMRSK